MALNPIQSKRTIGLDIQTIHIDESQPDRARSAGTGIIIAIGVIVDDDTQVAEYNFCNTAEVDLLRAFWRAVQPHDVFVGHGISNQLTFLRRRSWELDLIPSPEIDLRTVYQHHTLDPASLRAISGDDEYGSVTALLSLFGLPGKTPAIKQLPGDYMRDQNQRWPQGLEVDRRLELLQCCLTTAGVTICRRQLSMKTYFT